MQSHRRWRRKPPEQVALESVREAEFQAQVRKLALACGWMWYHTHDSRRSVSGYPDATLLKPPRLLYVELKQEQGQVSDEQRLWLETLSEIRGVECYVWRPRDIGEIERLLSGVAE